MGRRAHRASAGISLTHPAIEALTIRPAHSVFLFLPHHPSRAGGTAYTRVVRAMTINLTSTDWTAAAAAVTRAAMAAR